MASVEEPQPPVQLQVDGSSGSVKSHPAGAPQVNFGDFAPSLDTFAGAQSSLYENLCGHINSAVGGLFVALTRKLTAQHQRGHSRRTRTTALHTIGNRKKDDTCSAECSDAQQLPSQHVACLLAPSA